MTGKYGGQGEQREAKKQRVMDSRVSGLHWDAMEEWVGGQPVMAFRLLIMSFDSYEHEGRVHVRVSE